MIYRGGTNEERLYLYDLKMDGENDVCQVLKTDMPDIENIIARHMARYYFVASFCRPKMKVLDFPCGSGYGSEVLKNLHIDYEGRDYDQITLDYASSFYKGFFAHGDLIKPNLRERHYDLIACIEGLEHIERKYQGLLIKDFYDALKDGGTLIITTPEPSGYKNPYHLSELSKSEFTLLLTTFPDVQILEVPEKNHKRIETNFMYGVCRKDG